MIRNAEIARTRHPIPAFPPSFALFTHMYIEALKARLVIQRVRELVRANWCYWFGCGIHLNLIAPKLLTGADQAPACLSGLITASVRFQKSLLFDQFTLWVLSYCLGKLIFCSQCSSVCTDFTFSHCRGLTML